MNTKEKPSGQINIKQNRKDKNAKNAYQNRITATTNRYCLLEQL